MNPPNKERVELFRTPVAGLQFHKAWDLPTPIYQSTWASLEREPSNRYDPLAIKVIARDGCFLGYIPKNLTSEVHRLWQFNPAAEVLLHQPKVIVISVSIEPTPTNPTKAEDFINKDERPQI